MRFTAGEFSGKLQTRVWRNNPARERRWVVGGLRRPQAVEHRSGWDNEPECLGSAPAARRDIPRRFECGGFLKSDASPQPRTGLEDRRGSDWRPLEGLRCFREAWQQRGRGRFNPTCLA